MTANEHGHAFTAPRSMTSRLPRDPSADVLRGIGILAVVLFHSFFIVTSPNSSALLMKDASDILRISMKTLEPARMPAMMFIAGFFASRSLSRAPPIQFVTRKGRGVLYPFLLWSAVFVLLKSIKSLSSNSLSFDAVLNYIQHPAAHMWFLGYLFLYFLIVASFWKYKPYLLAGSITFLFATQFGGVTDLNKFIYLFTFFMFGALVSSNIMALAMKIHPALEVIACVVLFSFVACLVNADLLGSKYELFALPIGIMAVMAMILLAGIIAQTGGAPCRLLIFFGTMSLEVYLLHWTIINVICLRLPGIVAEQHGDLVVLYVFSASLAATILSVWGARLLKLDFLFALPKRAEGRLAQPRTAEV